MQIILRGRAGRKSQVAGREQKHCSVVSREGAKTRRLEGECPHEPLGRGTVLAMGC